MWRNTIPLEPQMLRTFEDKFHFKINEPLREFLLINNGGFPSPGIFHTEKRERKLNRLLDFNDRTSADGAFTVNARLRDKIGDKRIVVGVDSTGNFVCVERDYKQQYIVVWSHVTGDFERSLLDIPVFLRQIG